MSHSPANSTVVVDGSRVLLLNATMNSTRIMDSKDETEQMPLVAGDDCGGQARSKRFGIRRHGQLRQMLFWLLAVELANLLLFLGVPRLVDVVQTMRKRAGLHPLDDYFSLDHFNETRVYVNDETYDPGAISQQDAWDEIYLQYGIVSISDEWAVAHGFRPSAPTPGVTGQMVYQVDVFHNLHCLSLMCNAAIMLGVTEDYEDYGVLERHSCKDFDAVVSWTERNSWKGFLEWTYQNNH
ncbi:hypothetical protein CTRI78_v001812 [Colletotrichum trifolii]|uniref:Cyclochlorotine biosynthesis protein R n=1 Tax=Colletotrichum trifolii TaxID=5466 RepID=A0A4R8RNF0_COLTR|nr:hypothetical protein CTRI78_v001812 [Colletotrichum trifolii]